MEFDELWFMWMKQLKPAEGFVQYVYDHTEEIEHNWAVNKSMMGYYSDGEDRAGFFSFMNRKYRLWSAGNVPQDDLLDSWFITHPPQSGVYPPFKAREDDSSIDTWRLGNG